MLEEMKTLKSYERLQIQRHILPFSWISDKRLRTVGKPAQQTQHDATHAYTGYVSLTSRLIRLASLW